MLKVFVGRKLRDQLTPTECADLIADFKRYKSKGELPITFGRDAPYDHPHTPPAVLAEVLKHIHLYDPKAPWSTQAMQFNRTSDTAHLIYCQGIQNTDHYALLSILTPNPHDKAKSRDIMLALARDAEKFRNGH